MSTSTSISAVVAPEEAEEPISLHLSIVGDHRPKRTGPGISSPPEQQPLVRITDIPAPHAGHIRILEINRPSARNAISTALLSALAAEVAAIQATWDGVDGVATRPSPTRALIIASADDKAFCAGADLKERRSFSAEDTLAFLALLRQTLRALEDLPVPTIAAVAGPALGGGLELALATHFRVMASTASVALPETRLGIVPGAGGTYRLASLIGKSRASKLVLTGRGISGKQAFDLGLADELVDVCKGGKARVRVMVLEASVDLAREICEGGPLATMSALQAMRDPSEEAESMAYAKLLRSKDRDEALRAFAEKRAPVFTGK
ncbi:hypothetical protein Daus18300_005354 [Diaporthe australafricana]|uniref:Enoyl-CoA hydratase n=1 Tax=Diaporthe australafricana TaxID=127596 RepID=A0ABR3X2H3_9PEZI